MIAHCLGIIVLFILSTNQLFVFGHLLQTLKNLKISTSDQLRWKITVDHSIKGYLQVTYYNDPTTCDQLNSIYYYQLATCLNSGDPNAVAEFVMLTAVLKEKEYHFQWTYYKDSQCTSIVGYPLGAKVLKDVCYKGASLDVIGMIPTTPPTGYSQNSLMIMLFDRKILCTSRNPATAIEAVFTPLGQCLYSYYGDMNYQSCNSNVFNELIYQSKDGSCTKSAHGLQHLPTDPCQSKDVNIDATYNGYSNFICFS